MMRRRLEGTVWGKGKSRGRDEKRGLFLQIGKKKETSLERGGFLGGGWQGEKTSSNKKTPFILLAFGAAVEGGAAETKQKRIFLG